MRAAHGPSTSNTATEPRRARGSAKSLVGAFVFGVLSLSALGAEIPDIPAEAKARIDAAAPKRATVTQHPPRKVLVFSLALGFRHSSIPYGAYALRRMGELTGAYTATVTDDVEALRAENLRQYDAVFMNNTTGNPFVDEDLRQGFLAFVRNGGGLCGLHSSTDCSYDWEDYGRTMGGYFDGHPWHEEVTIEVEDPRHPLCAAFGGRDRFVVTDEIYQFKAPYSRDDLHVLFGLDPLATNLRKGGVNRGDGDFAVSWIHRYGKGRVYYCSLGHREEIYWNPVVLRCYLDGIQYALGDLAADDSPNPFTRIEDADPLAGTYAPLALAGTEDRSFEVQVAAKGAGEYGALVLRDGRPVGELTTHESPSELPPLHQNAEAAATGREPGVHYSLYHGSFDQLPDLDSRTPVKSGTTDGISLAVRDQDEEFALRFRGYFVVREAGLHRFTVTSDDGSRVFVDSRVVVDHDGLHGATPKSGDVQLEAGVHELKVWFFEKNGGEALSLGMTRIGEDDGPGLGLVGTLDGKNATARLADATLTLRSAGVAPATLVRTHRVSPAQFAPPPKDAVVLLPFAPGIAPSLDAFENPAWRTTADGCMEVELGAGDQRTKQDFGSVDLHVEFQIPYEPAAAGQGRGNSGVYLANRYEVQVLDSFGLAPELGGCAAIYGVAPPSGNFCLPPLSWQTYDVAYRAPRFAADGTLMRAPTMTVRHNGVLVHDSVPVPHPTTAAGESELGARGPLMFQDHGHRVRYRNVWLVEVGDSD